MVVKQIASGKTREFGTVDSIHPELLVAENHKSDQMIIIKTHELSGVCPFSGLPDFADLVIHYVPRAGKIVELKSFKYFLTSFYNVGVYQEQATDIIYEALKSVLELTDEDLHVWTNYNVRGGCDVEVERGNLSLRSYTPLSTQW